METLKISRDSWHCRLVMASVDIYSLDGLDLCGYTRKIILSFLLAGASIASWVYLAWLSYAESGLGGLATVLGVTVILLTPHLWISRVRKLSSHPKKPGYKTPPPGFVKEAYLSWKGKYCKRIEFKD